MNSESKAIQQSAHTSILSDSRLDRPIDQSPHAYNASSREMVRFQMHALRNHPAPLPLLLGTNKRFLPAQARIPARSPDHGLLKLNRELCIPTCPKEQIDVRALARFQLTAHHRFRRRRRHPRPLNPAKSDSAPVRSPTRCRRVVDVQPPIRPLESRSVLFVRGGIQMGRKRPSYHFQGSCAES